RRRAMDVAHSLRRYHLNARTSDLSTQLQVAAKFTGAGHMNIRMLTLALACSLAVVALLLSNRRPVAAQDPPPKQVSAGDIAQGKYLVQHVAQCIQCHTPRDAEGELISTRLLSGAAIPLQAPPNMAPWAAESA